jgi:MFS family permease
MMPGKYHKATINVLDVAFKEHETQIVEIGESTMELSLTSRSARAAVGTVALAAVLNPLNTSMIAVALPELGRIFGVSIGSSTRLLSAFAVASAVGHPLAGGLAERLGPRCVLVSGLIVTGVSGLAASYASDFNLLIALRVVQAFGTSAAYPAGIAILRAIDAGRNPEGHLPAAWLGVVTMSTNLSATIGPALAGLFLATGGWRWIFLVNVPLTLAGAVLVLYFLPPDHRHRHRAFVSFRALAANRPLLSVYARFAAVCMVFYSVFFGLPLWLENERRLSAAVVGAIMLPLVGLSALATPLAVRMVSRSGITKTLLLGAGALSLSTCLLAMVGARTSLIVLIAIVGLLGATNAFNNLGLQVELTDVTVSDQLGTAAGFFQTARFVGGAGAAGLIGIAFAKGATTNGWHWLCVAVVALSLALLVFAARTAAASRVQYLSIQTNYGKTEGLDHEK